MYLKNDLKGKGMVVEIESVSKHEASCNFCHRGELKGLGMKFTYPYIEVLTFTRETSGIKPSICASCLKELIEKSQSFIDDSNPF